MPVSRSPVKCVTFHRRHSCSFGARCGHSKRSRARVFRHKSLHKARCLCRHSDPPFPTNESASAAHTTPFTLRAALAVVATLAASPSRERGGLEAVLSAAPCLVTCINALADEALHAWVEAESLRADGARESTLLPPPAEVPNKSGPAGARLCAAIALFNLLDIDNKPQLFWEGVLKNGACLQLCLLILFMSSPAFAVPPSVAARRAAAAGLANALAAAIAASLDAGLGDAQNTIVRDTLARAAACYYSLVHNFLHHDLALENYPGCGGSRCCRALHV